MQIYFVLTASVSSVDAIGVISVGEYEHLRSGAERLQGENGSLLFELSDLKMYVDYLEKENTCLTQD